MARRGGVRLSKRTVAELRRGLPEVAERTIEAVTEEVPSYSDALTGRMGENIRGAVELALGFTPNSDSPILGCGFSSSTLTSFLSVFAPDLAAAPFATRTPRMLLTLPSFRLHALRRQLQI